MENSWTELCSFRCGKREPDCVVDGRAASRGDLFQLTFASEGNSTDNVFQLFPFSLQFRTDRIRNFGRMASTAFSEWGRHQPNESHETQPTTDSIMLTSSEYRKLANHCPVTGNYSHDVRRMIAPGRRPEIVLTRADGVAYGCAFVVDPIHLSSHNWLRASVRYSDNRRRAHSNYKRMFFIIRFPSSFRIVDFIIVTLSMPNYY